MRKVRWTAEAERWLREIHDYFLVDCGIDIVGASHGALDIERHLE
jgi:hypothetical protein